MRGYRADELDLYRLKAAETERERVRILEEAVARAVDRAQVNYLLWTITIAVLLVVLTQSLGIMGLRPVPVDAYRWCILVMAALIVLPWQLRRLRAFL